MDQLRIDPQRRGCVDAVFSSDRRAERFHHDIAGLDQPYRQLVRFRRCQIDREAFLAAVHAVKIDTVLLVAGCIVPAAVTDAAVLDLNDLSAQIAQHLRTPRPGQQPGPVEHPDARKREVAGIERAALGKLRHSQRPLKLALRFSRKAEMPSCLSSVP